LLRLVEGRANVRTLPHQTDNGDWWTAGVRQMKRSSWRSAAWDDGPLDVLWEDGDRAFCRAWRENADGGWRAVLAVAPLAEHPAPSTLNRLAREYGLKDDLDEVWAARPLELVRARGRMILMLELPSSEPLQHLIGPPMEIGRFLRLAIALTAALGRVHGRGLIHKDIKPTNMLVDSASGRVWLTGFGLASRLLRERLSPEPPEFIEGALAYMAPEQTGRMNRSIDSRSDLYSLGVTFYQMLAGSLPFTASDPLEWVHCHIARKPLPLHERSSSVPATISAIIMKLLAKMAEERYQTAAGVEGDLQRCLADWETRRRIDEFSLGKHDIPDRLLIPETLTASWGAARRSSCSSRDTPASASLQLFTSCTRCLFLRAGFLPQANSINTNATSLMRL
jgi:serine/threonine protein kinase